MDESPAKHLETHEQWRFDVGICMSEWLQLKIHHNYQDKELHQMVAVFLGNQDTVNFLRGALWGWRIVHICVSESLLVVYDIFGISLPFETPCTQYRK